MAGHGFVGVSHSQLLTWPNRTRQATPESHADYRVSVIASTPNSHDPYRFFTNTDQHIIDTFAQLHGRWPRLDRMATYLAANAPEIYALGFIAAWYGLKPANIETRTAIIRSVLTGGASVMGARLIAQLTPRTRPFASPNPTIASLVDHRPSHSFPSTHSAGSVGFVVGLGAHPTALACLFRPLTLGVLGSRIYSGLHWPSDVAAGALVGAGCAAALWAPAHRRWQRWLTQEIADLTPWLD